MICLLMFSSDSCSDYILRFSGIHLETKTGEKKERFIVVTKVKSEDDLKKKELEKQAAEIVSEYLKGYFYLVQDLTNFFV